MRYPIDIAIMFATLWLLGSMVVDILTPKELTVYMIAAATAPAAIGTGLCSYFRLPRIDFAMISAALWLLASLVIELLSPVLLPNFVIAAGLAPPLMLGVVLHWYSYRSNKHRTTGGRQIQPKRWA